MALYVSLGFKKLKDDGLVTFANTVFERMIVDSKYVSLKSAVEGMKTGKELFSSAISTATLGGKDRLNNRNMAKTELHRLLIVIARKLEDMAGDNPRIITDAGFEVRSSAKAAKTSEEPITELEVPVLTVTNLTKKRCVRLNWSEVDNAIDFDIRYKLQKNADWITDVHYHLNEFIFDDLESKNVYDFQIRARAQFGVSSDWTETESAWIS